MFVKSKEFAAAIKGTDNYYVIVTRENLFELPISVEAIYGIKGRKYFQLKRTYNSLYQKKKKIKKLKEKKMKLMKISKVHLYTVLMKKMNFLLRKK